jgi:hypothetical protein
MAGGVTSLLYSLLIQILRGLVLLGVEVFAAALLQGRHLCSPGSPIAFDTLGFGWMYLTRVLLIH